MRLLTHPVVSAFGFSVLCCMSLTAPLISPSHTLIYHNSGPVAALFIAALLDVAILWLIFTGLLLVAKSRGQLWVIVWLTLILMSPWVLLKEGATLQAWLVPKLMSRTLFFGSGLCLLAIVLFWQPSFLPTFRRIQSFVATLVGFSAIVGVITISQLLWCFRQARVLNMSNPSHHRPLATRGVTTQPKPRVIWIVLDELSYQQIYEHRFTKLELPAFDAVASQSTVFTHVVPAGIFTENVIPSLVTGQPVDHIRSSADGNQLSTQTFKAWHAFDQHATIFQDALDAGYSTAIVGWYNPYCRILSDVLDQCYWTSHPTNDGGAIGVASIITNAIAPARNLIESGLLLFFARKDSHTSKREEAKRHINDYRNLVEAGDERLRDSSSDFLFLHMPIPHPGGIYDRRTGLFSMNEGSYIDNLSLADQYLGHVYALLEKKGEWDSSIVLIMGDHSWRTQLLWSTSHIWTSEDQIASRGGQFDDRPAYIVKMPQQNQPLRIETSFPAIRTRALLQGVLNGRIRSTGDLSAFVNEKSMMTGQ